MVHLLEAPSIGGVPQYVILRGESLNLPVVLFLHGGPGAPLFPYVQKISATTGLESQFMLAYWEQRGTGKSLRGIPAGGRLTLELLLSDTLEMTEWLCARFGVDRIYLMGHSWGTILGVLAVKAKPERFFAYVGIGQVGSVAKGEAISYDWACAEAKRRQHRVAINELAQLGPPPHDHIGMLKERKWIMRFGGFVWNRSYPGWGELREILVTPEYHVGDLLRIARHPYLSLQQLIKDKNRVDLFAQAPVLGVPIIFMMGRHDRTTPWEVALAYFEALQAPRKQWQWFERSAHHPHLEEARAFGETVTVALRQ